MHLEQGNTPSGFSNNFPGGFGGGFPGGNQPGKDGDKKNEPQKKKWEPPVPTRVGRKKKRGPSAASKLPPVYPTTRCRLRLLKMERIKDYLLLEEEFIGNQERLKPEVAPQDKGEEDRSKVDDLRGTPMAVGTLEEIIDDDHAIISTASGPEYYVSIMTFVDKDQLEPGCTVLLHHKTHAVIGVLKDDTDPMVNVMKLDKAPTESYADVGGLEQQIQEIKVRSSSISTIFEMLINSIGIRRTSPHAPRTLRGNGYQTSKGCHSIWCPRNGQDPPRKGRCKPNVCYFPAYSRFRAYSEIPWRWTKTCPRAVPCRRGTCTKYRIHRRN